MPASDRDAQPQQRASLLRRRLKTGATAALALLILAATAWAAPALFITAPGVGGTLAAVAASGGCALHALRRRRAPALALHGLALAGVALWWSAIEPSNLRNFDYRSKFDYRPQWLTRHYDLARIEGVDLVAVYWMGPAIAHIFVSLAFAGDEQLAISIETRKEKSEAYSTIRGFSASTSSTTRSATSAS
jgi:hypothetical protein